MKWLPPWAWHSALMFVALRFGWAALRRYLGRDPAVWLVLRLKLRGTHRRRTTEVIRWTVITGIVVLVVGASYGVQSVVANYSPHEGDAADPVLVVTETRAFQRDPAKDLPFYADVYLSIAGDKRVVDVCQAALLEATGADEQSQAIDQAFDWLRAGLDAGVPHKCNQWSPGQTPFITVFPTPVIRDADVAKPVGGDKSIYVLVAWSYRLEGSPDLYVQEYCAFFNGTLGNVKVCPGEHNGARLSRHFIVVGADATQYTLIGIAAVVLIGAIVLLIWFFKWRSATKPVTAKSEQRLSAYDKQQRIKEIDALLVALTNKSRVALHAAMAIEPMMVGSGGPEDGVDAFANRLDALKRDFAEAANGLQAIFDSYPAYEDIKKLCTYEYWKYIAPHRDGVHGPSTGVAQLLRQNREAIPVAWDFFKSRPEVKKFTDGIRHYGAWLTDTKQALLTERIKMGQ